jgi:multidrug resistance protein, MATE family
MTNIEYSHLNSDEHVDSTNSLEKDMEYGIELPSIGHDSETDTASMSSDRTSMENKSEFELDIDTPTLVKVKVLVLQAFPIIISFFLGLGGSFVNLMYAGTYTYHGKAATVFAAVSLANMFCNMTFLSLLIGLSTAVETLGSQHNGAKNYREVGIVLQRSIVVLGSLIPISLFVWFHAAVVFHFMGIEKDVCEIIRNYVRIRALTMPIDVLYVSYEKYLMSIGVVHPTMWDGIGFNLLIIFFNSIFVYYFKFGYQCLAWTWVISSYLRTFIQMSMSWRYEEVQRTLQKPSKEAFEKLHDFVALGLPGTIMICSEWWAYEILTIFASILGTESVASQAIILQVASLCFMVPIGLSIATASFVGNALGAGKKQLAIAISNLALCVIMVLQLIVAMVVLFGGATFVDSFTTDALVRKISLRAMPFLAAFTWFDALQGVCSGILRGAGKQSTGAVANVFSFYAIGLPMAWTICFTLGKGVNGLMMGLSIGVSVQVSVLLFLVKCRRDYTFSSPIIESGVKESSTQEIEAVSEGRSVKTDASTSNTTVKKVVSLLRLTYSRKSSAAHNWYKQLESEDDSELIVPC